MFRLMPEGYRKKIELWLKYSGSRLRPGSFFNNVFAVSLAIGLVFAFLLGGQWFLVVFIGVFLAAFSLMHGFLLLAVEKRSNMVENILPDALQLMAANSRAGHIPSRALLLSARNEFGPLSDAIKMVGKEIITGKPFEPALKDISRYIKSEILDRTIRLIIEGVRAGGQFASLLEENADDIVRVHSLKKEVKANITMYTIFIAFAGCIGAPVLYALSSFLVSTISRFEGLHELSQTTTLNIPFVQFSGFSVSQEFLLLFSLSAILITTIFGSLIIGLISTGKERSGIKYIPIFVIFSLLIFFVTKFVIQSMFGNLLI